MVDTTFMIILGVLIPLCATFMFLSLKAAIEHESLFKFFISLLLALFSVFGIIFCAEKATEETDRMIKQCVDLGYDTAQYNNDSWYCIEFSNEPDIIKLEGEK